MFFFCRARDEQQQPNDPCSFVLLPSRVRGRGTRIGWSCREIIPCSFACGELACNTSERPRISSAERWRYGKTWARTSASANPANPYHLRQNVLLRSGLGSTWMWYLSSHSSSEFPAVRICCRRRYLSIVELLSPLPVCFAVFFCL
ncbi:unnamed protein product [Ectocarpus fasciculatus]